MRAMSEIADRLQVLELALARRDETAIPGGLGTLIDDEFLEIGASGRRWDRAAILDLLGVAPAEDVAIERFAAAPIAANAVLVTYRSVARRPGLPARSAWRSSIWIRGGADWRIRFHQGTPAIGDPPAPR
jgi:ribonuclease HI